MKTKFKSEEEKMAYVIAIIHNTWNEYFEMPSGEKYIFPKPRCGKVKLSQLLDSTIAGYNMSAEEANKKINELINLE